jgi:anti-sigma factor RsiW
MTPPASTTDGDLGCEQVVEIITDYLEDALDPRGRLEVEEHLALCLGCQVYLEQMRDCPGVGSRPDRHPVGASAGRPDDGLPSVPSARRRWSVTP